MLSPAPVAVKTQNPEPKISAAAAACSLNPNAAPFVNNNAAHRTLCGSAKSTLSPAPAPPPPPQMMMTSAPLPLSMRPPLLPHQFFHRPPASTPPPPSPPVLSYPTPASAAASIPVPNFPHHHYYYYYHHRQFQTALYGSIRPTYPHPAAAFSHHFSAAAAAASSSSSSPCSYYINNNQYRGSAGNYQTPHPLQPPQNVVVRYTTVHPELKPKPAPEPEPGSKSGAGMMTIGSGGGGKVIHNQQGRCGGRIGMVLTRRKVVGPTRGGSRSRIRASPPALKKKWVSSSSSSSSSSTITVTAASDGAGEESVVTSLMIKNIPNHFQRFHLLQYLDSHCADENKKLQQQKPRDSDSSGSSDDDGGVVLSEYDFVYLPMDFWTGANLGYAFVNFTTSVASAKFRHSFHGYKWNAAASKSKICEITAAAIQGKEKLMHHFRNSKFRCRFDCYLPVVFSPPRGGLTTTTTATRSSSALIGLRLPPKPHHHLVRRNNNPPRMANGWS